MCCVKFDQLDLARRATATPLAQNRVVKEGSATPTYARKKLEYKLHQRLPLYQADIIIGALSTRHAVDPRLGVGRVHTYTSAPTDRKAWSLFCVQICPYTYWQASNAALAFLMGTYKWSPKMRYWLQKMKTL